MEKLTSHTAQLACTTVVFAKDFRKDSGGEIKTALQATNGVSLVFNDKGL